MSNLLKETLLLLSVSIFSTVLIYISIAVAMTSKGKTKKIAEVFIFLGCTISCLVLVLQVWLFT